VTPPPIAELEKCLARLPGFGRRSASRAALALVREPARLLLPLADALRVASADVRCCSRCGAFTTVGRDPCPLCSDETRDGRVVCVVEDPADIISIEASGAFRGRYHALGGKLAPERRSGPGRLRLAELQDRVVREGFLEVLLALSTDMDGDATAGYIAEMLSGSGARVTRLAFGLPTDSGVAYSDPLTLKRAINGRQPLA
jgi:recombination protein RecR